MKCRLGIKQQGIYKNYHPTTEAAKKDEIFPEEAVHVVKNNALNEKGSAR